MWLTCVFYLVKKSHSAQTFVIRKLNGNDKLIEAVSKQHGCAVAVPRRQRTPHYCGVCRSTYFDFDAHLSDGNHLLLLQQSATAQATARTPRRGPSVSPSGSSSRSTEAYTAAQL